MAPFFIMVLKCHRVESVTVNVSVQFIIVYGLINYEPLKYHDYEYPIWVNFIGLLVASSSVLCIPITALWSILNQPGSLKEVRSDATVAVV